MSSPAGLRTTAGRIPHAPTVNLGCPVSPVGGGGPHVVDPSFVTFTLYRTGALERAGTVTVTTMSLQPSKATGPLRLTTVAVFARYVRSRLADDERAEE